MSGRIGQEPAVIGQEPAVSSVVHVVSSFPPALGGMEQVAESIALAQHESGLAVRVLTSRYGYDQAREPDLPFPVARMRCAYVAHTQIYPGLVARLGRLDRASLLHLHVSAAYTPEVTWAYARLTRRPYFAHVHLDVMSSGRAGLLLGPYQRVLLARVLRQAAGVIVPTPDYQELISAKYSIPVNRIFVVENGTWHGISARARSLGTADGPRKLLFVGRLSVQKNLPLMIDSVAAYVQRHGRDIELLIVGDGELRGALEAQVARCGLGGIVTFRGAVHGAQLEALYQEADLFLLTSFRESFGLVLVEAMTKGLPIVGVNIPAVRNVAEDGVNGLLAEANPPAIADAIHRVLTDHQFYAAASSRNLAKARDFDWAVVARKLAAVYRMAG